MHSLPFQLFLLIQHIASLALRFPLHKTSISYDITLYQKVPLLSNIPFLLPSFSLCFGTPKSQCFQLGVSTTTASTVLEDIESPKRHFNGQFKSNESVSFDMESSKAQVRFYVIQAQALRLMSRVVLDYIHFPNEPPLSQKFPFLLGKSNEQLKPIEIDGFVGMKKSHYEPFSRQNSTALLNHLNKLKLIDEKVFSLKYNRDGSGEFTLGEEKGRNGMGSYAECKSSALDQENLFWDSSLNRVRIGEAMIRLTDDLIRFDSVRNYIVGPYEKGKAIFDYVIRLFSQCRMQEEKGYALMLCDASIDMEKMPDLHFDIQEIDLRVEWRDLLRLIKVNDTNAYVSLFFLERNNEEEAHNNWTLGFPGFINRTIVFNKTGNSIGIISSADNWAVYDYSIAITLYILVLLLLVLGVVYILIIIKTSKLL